MFAYWRFSFFSVCMLGGAWTLYCLTPAGAHERELARREKVARQLAEDASKRAPKRGTV